MNSGRLLLAPALLAVLVLAQASGAGSLALALAGIVLILWLIGPRWELDRGRQIVSSVIGAGTAYTLVSLLYEFLPGHLTEGWTRASACILLAAAARFIQPRPGGGAVVTVLGLLLSVLVAGEGRSRGGILPLGVWSYPLLSLLFLVVALLALRLGDPDRPALRARSVGSSLLLLLLALGLSAGGVVGLRFAQARLTHRSHSVSFAQRVRVGFSEQVELGALGGMLESDTIALRLFGPRVDYLRGAVFDTYEVGRWNRSDARAAEREETWGDAQPEGDVVTLQALSEATDRFFLPLAARQLRPSPESVKVDPLGGVRRINKGPPLSVRFVVGPRERAAPDAPGTQDLALSRRVRTRLGALANEWMKGATSPEEKLDAIERHFQAEFRYERVFRRDNDLDPVVDFLLRERNGHCEYFASGMVLMARMAGIPTRLVAGYRVAERNELGGYYVVRERNAHAWVEAWIEGRGWVTRDPTPEGPVTSNHPHKTSLVSALLDLIRIRYDEFVAWFGRRTLFQLTGASLLGLLILGWLVARGVQRKAAPAPVHKEEEALPFLQKLLAALAAHGVAHEPHEDLTHLAMRVPDPEVAALLRRYEALRYGGEGDAEALAGEMEQCAEKIRRKVAG